MSRSYDVPNGATPFETVINRIKAVEGFEKDKDVAQALQMDPRNLASQKSAGSIPYERVIEYSRYKLISLEYLLNGNGPPQRKELQLGVAEPGAIYKVETDQDVLYEIAGAVYRALTELGSVVTPEKFSLTVRLAHRDMLDRNNKSVPYAKIVELVKLAL